MKIIRTKARLISEITIDEDVDWGGFGITNIKEIALIHCGGLRLEDTLADDLCWSGLIFKGTAGENLAQFETVYRKNDAKYWKAKADSADTMPVIALAVEPIEADAEGRFILFGWMRNDAWTLSVGGAAFQSAATAGLVTTTIPAASGNQIQKLGLAITTNIAHFMPEVTTLEVT